MGLNEYGLKRLVEMSRSGEVSPLEVARDLVQAIAAREKDIGAYLDFDGDRLLEQAETVTSAGDYKDKVLAGIPIAIKDNICSREE